MIGTLKNKGIINWNQKRNVFKNSHSELCILPQFKILTFLLFLNFWDFFHFLLLMESSRNIRISKYGLTFPVFSATNSVQFISFNFEHPVLSQLAQLSLSLALLRPSLFYTFSPTCQSLMKIVVMTYYIFPSLILLSNKVIDYNLIKVRPYSWNFNDYCIIWKCNRKCLLTICMKRTIL